MGRFGFRSHRNNAATAATGTTTATTISPDKIDFRELRRFKTRAETILGKPRLDYDATTRTIDEAGNIIKLLNRREGSATTRAEVEDIAHEIRRGYRLEYAFAAVTFALMVAAEVLDRNGYRNPFFSFFFMVPFALGVNAHSTKKRMMNENELLHMANERLNTLITEVSDLRRRLTRSLQQGRYAGPTDETE